MLVRNKGDAGSAALCCERPPLFCSEHTEHKTHGLCLCMCVHPQYMYIRNNSFWALNGDFLGIRVLELTFWVSGYLMLPMGIRVFKYNFLGVRSVRTSVLCFCKDNLL